MASWNTQGLSSKKGDIVSIFDGLHGGEERLGALVLLELHGTPEDAWFWHSDCALILQRYREGDDQMWTGIIVGRYSNRRRRTGHMTAVTTWKSVWRELGVSLLQFT